MKKARPCPFSASDPMSPPLSDVAAASAAGHSSSLARAPAAAPTSGPIQASTRFPADGRSSPAADALRRCFDPASSDEDWRLFHERHESALRNIVARTMRVAGLNVQEHDVDELCQEVYLRWWRGNASFTGRTDGAFWSFICASVRHTLMDRQRFFSAAKRQSAGVFIACCSREPGPYARLELREQRRVVLRHCLNTAEADCGGGRPQAMALGWVVLGGYTSKEASRLAGVDAKRVDHLVRRLRQRMAREGIDLPHRGVI